MIKKYINSLALIFITFSQLATAMEADHHELIQLIKSTQNAPICYEDYVRIEQLCRQIPREFINTIIDDQGNTLLHCAVLSGHPELLRIIQRIDGISFILQNHNELTYMDLIQAIQNNQLRQDMTLLSPRTPPTKKRTYQPNFFDAEIPAKAKKIDDQPNSGNTASEEADDDAELKIAVNLDDYSTLDNGGSGLPHSALLPNHPENPLELIEKLNDVDFSYPNTNEPQTITEIDLMSFDFERPHFEIPSQPFVEQSPPWPPYEVASCFTNFDCVEPNPKIPNQPNSDNTDAEEHVHGNTSRDAPTLQIDEIEQAKKFICKFSQHGCSYKTNLKGSLKLHETTCKKNPHKDEIVQAKNLSCKFFTQGCTYKTNRTSSLKLHEATCKKNPHKDEIEQAQNLTCKFSTQGCTYKTTRKGHLKRHETTCMKNPNKNEIVQAKNLSCKFSTEGCTYKTSRKTDLKKHEAMCAKNPHKDQIQQTQNK